MDLMPGNLARMIFHRLDLPFPLFRGSKGPIRKKLSLQQLWRPYRIHTLLVPAIWSVYGSLIACASWIERMYV
jgi:hypothetical protein